KINKLKPMKKYTTESTSRNSANLIDPIIIDQKTRTRKVLYATINDKKVSSRETVSIILTHQRKPNNHDWEDVSSVNLSELKGGEGVKLQLSSEMTRKIYDELTRLYKIVDKRGIYFGNQEFLVGTPDEIIQVSA